MRGATRISKLAYTVSQWVDRRVEDYRYDDIHQRTAERVYEVICAQHPGRRPAESVLRRIDAYARDVLGSPTFSGWLRVYTAWDGEFQEGWIPDNYFGRVVLPAIQGPALPLGMYKTLSRRLTLSGDLLPDLAYRIRGQWVGIDGQALAPSEVEDVVFEHEPRAVVKLDDSNQGKGVQLIERGQDDLFALAGDFVVQRMMYQHEWLARFNPDNMTTIRITTVKPPGLPAEWRGGMIKLGFSGSEILRSADSIRLAIMDAEGLLGEFGALHDWTRITKHPETGVAWGGQKIPDFERALDLCTRLHDGFPHATVIGWDVAMERSGDFSLLEWNTLHPGIVYSEANAGPLFRGLGWEDLWKE